MQLPEKDHAFYRKAYEITGQNSFEELMSDYIYHLFLQILSKYPLKAPDKLAILTIEAIARFYTFGLADSLKYWICQDTPFQVKRFTPLIIILFVTLYSIY